MGEVRAGLLAYLTQYRWKMTCCGLRLLDAVPNVTMCLHGDWPDFVPTNEGRERTLHCCAFATVVCCV